MHIFSFFIAIVTVYANMCLMNAHFFDIYIINIM
jgi:hypothetical protein